MLHVVVQPAVRRYEQLLVLQVNAGWRTRAHGQPIDIITFWLEAAA